jgi:hypothetical protein
MKSEKRKMNKALLGVIIVVCACLVLGGTYMILYNINSKPDVASSTAENCEIIHNIFIQEDENQMSFKSKYLMDYGDYRDQTLYNLGLCNSPNIKEWNGTWIIDEDFIRTYITNYSAEEFMQVYDIYINGFTSAGIYQKDKSFYENSEELLEYISQTTLSLFEMTDLFEVADYHPTEDKVLNTTTETKQVHGTYNTGSDNHIASMKGEITTDTYEYDGYTVTHVYGDKYDSGQYGWVEGEFIDISAHFDKVNNYYLYVGDKCIMGPAKNIEQLNCRWLVVGETKYYEWALSGGQISYGSGNSYYIRFPKPVSVLTAKSQNAAEKYFKYD